MIETVTIVKVFPTAIWIEDTIWGDRRVMLQHEGCEPFAYATFGYDYRYTSNYGTRQAAHDLARSLGAQEPIEHRPGSFPRFRWWHHVAYWVIRCREKVRAATVRREP